MRAWYGQIWVRIFLSLPMTIFSLHPHTTGGRAESLLRMAHVPFMRLCLMTSTTSKQHQCGLRLHYVLGECKQSVHNRQNRNWADLFDLMSENPQLALIGPDWSQLIYVAKEPWERIGSEIIEQFYMNDTEKSLRKAFPKPKAGSRQKGKATGTHQRVGQEDRAGKGTPG